MTEKVKLVGEVCAPRTVKVFPYQHPRFNRVPFSRKGGGRWEKGQG